MPKSLPVTLFCILLSVCAPLVFAAEPSLVSEIAGYSGSDQAVVRSGLHQHRGSVLALARQGTSDAFFSAGEDGFISLHDPLGNSHIWQISDMPIKMIAVHPDGNLIASYETDGFSVHRLSLWSWKDKKRLYAKRFREAITSVSWSAKGTYVMIGNTSLDGITVLTGESGKPKKIFDTSPGPVSLSHTGAKETSVITFGPLGAIRYTEISNGKQRAVYQGPAHISSPSLFDNNRRITGFSGTHVLSIDATSGKVVQEFPTTKAIMATGSFDNQPMWFSPSGEDWQLCREDKTSAPFATTDYEAITTALAMESKIVFGSETGRLYEIPKPLDTQFQDTVLTPTVLTDAKIVPIDDIVSNGNTLYLLSGGSVFSVAGPSQSPTLVFSGITANRFRMIEDAFLFWSWNSGGDVLMTSLQGDNPKVLYTAQEGIRSLTLFGRQIACVEGTSRAVVFSPSLTKPFVYEGAGLQDAVLVSIESLIVSKSSTSRSPHPLLHIHTRTRETVPLPVQGELSFGLQPSPQNPHELLVFLVQAEGQSRTELVRIKIEGDDITSTTVDKKAVYPDEDLKALLFVENNAVLTNLGKGSLVEIDLRTLRQYPLERGYALPLKPEVLGSYMASLNYDGSLSWYRRSSRSLISTGYLSEDTFWIEE